MVWQIFSGSGQPSGTEPWTRIPAPPPWRTVETALKNYVEVEGLLDAVNASLHLRRPLLLTGNPGSGKSTLVNLIAEELGLGSTLSWHVTSRSTLTEALYQYDALGRLNASQLTGNGEDDESRVEKFVTLGPLGTALASRGRPRAVLVDEIDKCDIDLPGDLLHVLDMAEFEIPPLVRAAGSGAQSADGNFTHRVRGHDRETYAVANGVVAAEHMPVIVLTSNGERTFPAAFLRRCVRFEIPVPSEDFLVRLVTAYLGEVDDDSVRQAIKDFHERLERRENLALDQLLNYVYLVTGEAAPGSGSRKRVEELLLAELSGR